MTDDSEPKFYRALARDYLRQDRIESVNWRLAIQCFAGWLDERSEQSIVEVKLLRCRAAGWLAAPEGESPESTRDLIKQLYVLVKYLTMKSTDLASSVEQSAALLPMPGSRAHLAYLNDMLQHGLISQQEALAQLPAGMGAKIVKSESSTPIQLQIVASSDLKPRCQCGKYEITNPAHTYMEDIHGKHYLDRQCQIGQQVMMPSDGIARDDRCSWGCHYDTAGQFVRNPACTVHGASHNCMGAGCVICES